MTYWTEYWRMVRSLSCHPNRSANPAAALRAVLLLDVLQAVIQGVRGAVQCFGDEIELRDGGVRLTAFRIDRVLCAGGRVRERVDDVVHAERTTDQFLQFATVFGCVEHGLTGRAEFRKRLPACVQRLLPFVVVDVHSCAACHSERHDHGKDNRPGFAGIGRLFNGLILIIHMRPPLANRRMSSFFVLLTSPILRVRRWENLNGHPTHTNEAGSGRHTVSPQACRDRISTTSSDPRSRARSMAMSTKSTGRCRSAAICRTVNPAATSPTIRVTISPRPSSCGPTVRDVSRQPRAGMSNRPLPFTISIAMIGRRLRR